MAAMMINEREDGLSQRRCGAEPATEKQNTPNASSHPDLQRGPLCLKVLVSRGGGGGV